MVYNHKNKMVILLLCQEYLQYFVAVNINYGVKHIINYEIIYIMIVFLSLIKRPRKPVKN